MKQVFIVVLSLILSGQLLTAQNDSTAASDSARAARQKEKEYKHWLKVKDDWANLGRYQAANDTLEPPRKGEQRVVFMGNSITDGWIKYSPDFFSTHHFIDRGISGQTTPQMLIRFRPDVIDLKPEAVVILAGTNDIAGNTGPSTLEMIEENLASMAELAKANDIKVIL
ncbi:MAG TPA: GDSL-type esterase/lipase family protein, partial [Bacteroidales bacterium]|nr:GDSL-type esterase/lipase family protein [Bacteroidales bacterium]